MTTDDLTPAELDHFDPVYPLIITVRAQRRGESSHQP
jgi:hypothetical protein